MKFEIVLERPPEGVDFALQSGKGHPYTLLQKQRANGGDLRFVFELNWDGKSLRGALVQGPPTGRFVYINSGKAAGQHDSIWTRRLKVPLRDIHGGAQQWTITVPGTSRDGGPNCATVKPFPGWKEA